MKIDTFLALYKNKKDENSRAELITSHVKNKYIPLEEKQAMAENIVKSSYYQKDGDTEKFHVNSVAKYMLTGLTMVEMYTDIELDNSKGKALLNFNKLNEQRILDDILTNINEKEWTEFISVLEMVENDVIRNEHEPSSFVRNQLERFGNLISAALLPVLDNLNIDQIEEIAKKYIK